ncbi:MAG: hypothetical protein ACRD2C_14695 [Acidimicrobiales bacterium]
MSRRQVGAEAYQGESGPARGTGSWVPVFVGLGVIALLLVAIVVVLASDDDSGGSSSGTVESDDRREAVNLQTALLTQQDIGSGYVPFELGEPAQVEYEGGPECDAMIDLLNDGQETQDDAVAAFRSDPDLYVQHSIDWLDAGDAAIAEREAAVSACTEYQWVEPTATATAIQQRVPSDALGEGSVAYARNLHFTEDDGDEYAILQLIVVWERDGVLSTMSYLDAGTDVEPGDILVAGEIEGFVRGLTETADQRLRPVLEQ